MRKLILAGGLCLALAGCNTNLDPAVLTPNQALIAVNVYNTAVATGTGYLRLKLCTVVVPPCRTQVLSQAVYTALRSGRVARTQVLTALAANQAAPITAIQALEAAYAVIQQIPKQ